MNMVRVGIIGCGSITKLRHAPEYTANPDAVIAGFFDPIRERAEELAGQFNGKVYGSYEEMLSDGSIDAVSVCSSNSSHAAITIAALNAGKHVLCEKPMATTVEDAEKMLEASEKAERFLMVGHNQRLVPAHRRAKEILKNGELGRVLTFRTTFSHGGPESWSTEKSRKTWFFKKSEAIMGALGDLGIHKADLIRWLIGDEIAEVMAYVATLDKKDDVGQLIEVDDNAVCILKSKTGVIGTMTASWTNYGEEDNSTVLYCTDGIMKIFDEPEFFVAVCKKNGEKVCYKVGRIQSNDNQAKSGVIDLFVESIISNTAPEISGKEGLAALKIISACIESAQKGMAVKI